MYREIIAKTLVGKGRFTGSDLKVVTLPEEIDKALGCWIINHHFEAIKKDSNILLKGQYDIQLWYAMEDEKKTNVFHQTIPFEGTFVMSWRKLKMISEDVLLKVYVTKYPTAIDMHLIDKKTVEIKVNAGYLLDAFAEAVVTVECKEDDLDDSEMVDEIIMNVNPDYIENKDSN